MKTKRSAKVCHKIGYPNKRAAREAFNNFGKATGAKRYYKCPYHKCQEIWHLTSED